MKKGSVSSARGFGETDPFLILFDIYMISVQLSSRSHSESVLENTSFHQGALFETLTNLAHPISSI